MWAQILNAALGVWLMASPGVLGYGNPAADMQYIIGPVVATFATVACWGATRAVGRWNLPLGVWLVVSPFVLGFDGAVPTVNVVATGALITGLSFVKGRVEQRFGGGWAVLFRSGAMPKKDERA